MISGFLNQLSCPARLISIDCVILAADSYLLTPNLLSYFKDSGDGVFTLLQSWCRPTAGCSTDAQQVVAKIKGLKARPERAVDSDKRRGPNALTSVPNVR
jgi:hypothetical protein